MRKSYNNDVILIFPQIVLRNSLDPDSRSSGSGLIFLARIPAHSCLLHISRPLAPLLQLLQPFQVIFAPLVILQRVLQQVLINYLLCLTTTVPWSAVWRIRIHGIRTGIISLDPDPYPYQEMAGSGIRIQIRIKWYGSGSNHNRWKHKITLIFYTNLNK